MGPMSRDEKIMLGTMGAAVCLWVAGDALGISAGALRVGGVCVWVGGPGRGRAGQGGLLGLLQRAAAAQHAPAHGRPRPHRRPAPAVTTAMMGLCLLLGTGVLQWRECLTYPAAWDTLFWCVRVVCVCPCRRGQEGGVPGACRPRAGVSTAAHTFPARPGCLLIRPLAAPPPGSAPQVCCAGGHVGAAQIDGCDQPLCLA